MIDKLRKFFERPRSGKVLMTNEFLAGAHWEADRQREVTEAMIECLIAADGMRDYITNYCGGSVDEANYLKTLENLREKLGE